MEIKDITEESKAVEISGWVHGIKDLGGIKFIHVRDNSGIIQLIIDSSAQPELLSVIRELTKESVIKVKGSVQKGKNNQLEIVPSEIQIISKSDSELPLAVNIKKDTTSPDKRYDWRSLDLRKERQQIIFKVQSALIKGITQHLFSKGFTLTFTPCLLGAASESGSEVFPVIYFNKESFLRQDPQLHRQLTIAGGFTKIFDIGPCWRAEQSHTRKHLCEHRVCAVETAFIKDEQDIMRIEEGLIIAALEEVKQSCSRELEKLGVVIDIPKKPFPELRFPEIYSILEEKGKILGEGEDLDSESEKILTEYVKKQYKSDFFFINKFPFSIKPFYVMRDGKDSKWARSIDLYYKGLELSSGGQREHRYEEIIRSLKEKGMNPGEMEWFTKFFKYGVPPHGGFALGIERLTQSLLNIDNIRDCALFPRDPERLLP